MKTIIVPLDFSSESLTGLNMAMMLAKKTKADIQMVHVISKNADTNREALEKDNLRAQGKFEEILKKCKEQGNIHCGLNFHIKEGKTFIEITDLADKFEDSVIVLSTHGESGFEELFIGGNAYKITSHSKNPVITVRKSKLSENIDRIVLPLDMTYKTREKVPYTTKLAKIFNSEIHIVTVRESRIKSIEKKLHLYSEQVAEYLYTNGVPYVVEHIFGNNLTDITLDYAHSINAHLISIMTQQEKSLTNLLLGNHAHQMINKSTIPVLSFPTYSLGELLADFPASGVV